MKNLATLQKAALYLAGFIVTFWLLGVFANFINFNLFWWMPRFYLLFWALLLAINILFALGVMRDAETQNAAGRKTFFVDAPI